MAKIADLIKIYPDILPQIQEGEEDKRKRYEEMVEKHSYMCPSCGATEGELHELNCDMEICPKCGGQLISCGCCLEGEQPLDEERIPWICKPVVCARCGKSWPEPFHVEDWDDVIPPPLRGEPLCRDCYEKVKAIILNADHKYSPPQRWGTQRGGLSEIELLARGHAFFGNPIKGWGMRRPSSVIELPASLAPVLIRALSAWIDLVNERWRIRDKRRYIADEEIALAKLMLDKLRGR